MVCATKEDQDWTVLDMCGFVNADWARDLNQRGSTSGYVFNLFRGVVSWMSKKQSVVELSTPESEYRQPLMQARKQFGCRDCVQVWG